MLVSAAAVIEAVRRRRCLRSARPLEEGEILLSRTAMPNLYAGAKHKGEQDYVRDILEALMAALRGADTQDTDRAAIRAFMEKVIAHGMGRETYVHHFVFEFWETLWADEADRIVFAERYMWGRTDGVPSTEFALSVLPLIKDDKSYPDIVGRGGRAGTDLIVIDVKLDELDDRALGQIIRYYGLARRTIDFYRLGCDLRRVIPVLVVAESKQTKYWDAIPEHFREFLVVCFYRIEPDGKVVLHEARKELLSWSKQARLEALRA